jgi:SAM-dependent methyltransferase
MKLVWSTSHLDFFDGVPYPFDLEAVEERDGYRAALDFTTKVIGPPPAIILDIGCGCGRHVRPLVLSGYEVVALDLSDIAIRRTRVRAPGCLAIRADAERMPLRTECVDAAISLYSSIGYKDGAAKLISSEAARILRPGGILIVDVAGPQRKRLSIGMERVPRGFAACFRWNRGRRFFQRNFVLSWHVAGLYGLDYDALDASSALALVDSGSWKNQTLLGGFDGSPLSGQSERLIVVAERV